MNNVQELSQAILRALFNDFVSRALTADDLEDGYIGMDIPALKESFCGRGASGVDFDLALEELEDAKLVDTGPSEPYDNPSGATVVVIGCFSKREYTYLTTKGYKAAQKLRSTKGPQPRGHNATHLHVNISGGHFQQSPIGVGGKVAQSMTVASGGETVFGDLQKLVNESSMDEGDRARLRSAIEAMASAKNTPSFRDRYREFIAQAADYMTLIGLYLPALTGLLRSMSQR
jgi:hypothetical protein